MSRTFGEALPKVKPEKKDELEALITDIKAMVDSVQESTFSVRLKRWVGTWESTEYAEDGTPKYDPEVSSKAISRLAKDALDKPELLTDSMLKWLATEEAKRTEEFFSKIGALDTSRSCLPRLESAGQAGINVNLAICAYLAAHVQVDSNIVSAKVDEFLAAGLIHPKGALLVTKQLPSSKPAIERAKALVEAGKVDRAFVGQALAHSPWAKNLPAADFLGLLKLIDIADRDLAAIVIAALAFRHEMLKGLEPELLEYGEAALRVAKPTRDMGDYYCEILATAIATQNPDKGFALLESMLGKERGEDYWNPIEAYSRHPFFEKLRQIDGKKAYGILFKAAAKNGGICYEFKQMRMPKEDADLLSDYALLSEENALIVSRCLSGEHAAFWPTVLRIVIRYPDNPKIKAALARGVQRIDGVISGSLADHFRNSVSKVDEVLKESTLPSSVRTWLQDVSSYLNDLSKREVLRETDEEINDLRSEIGSSSSGERQWAIKRLLQLGKLHEVLKVVSKDELLSLLPELDLMPELAESIKGELRQK